MTSPRLLSAAASTRTETEVRASRPISMLDVIRGAVGVQTKCCPFCGEPPPLAARIAGKFVVGCENEDCAANPQVSAPTCAEAWARWNARVSADLERAGAGGIK